MATLDGRVLLAMKGGEIDSLLIELGGLDISQALGDLIGDKESVPIRCAFTDLKARNGQVRIKPFVVDTTDTLFTGEGKLNLDEEGINFVIAPHPKDFSLFAAATPLHIAGRFGDLDFYPDESGVARLTAAAILGVVATPFAAVIPLIETGTGKNADCKALLDTSEEAQRAEKSPSPEGQQRAEKSPSTAEKLEGGPAPYIERGHRP
jgi:uncharacterized protein involved in outer membrane biogenesis